jgi:hypothetical protein
VVIAIAGCRFFADQAAYHEDVTDNPVSRNFVLPFTPRPVINT